MCVGRGEGVQERGGDGRGRKKKKGRRRSGRRRRRREKTEEEGSPLLPFCTASFPSLDPSPSHFVG